MRRHIIAIVFFIGAVSICNGQVTDQLNANFNIALVTDITKYIPDSADITGTYSGSSYPASDLAKGDIFVDASRKAFFVKKVISVVGSTVKFRVLPLNVSLPANGNGVIFHPTKNGYPMSTGSTSFAMSMSLMNTSINAIDYDLPVRSSGNALPPSGYRLGALGLFRTAPYELTKDGWVPKVYKAVGSLPTPAVSYQNQVVKLGATYHFFDQVNLWQPITTTFTSLPEIPKMGDIFYNKSEQKLYMVAVDATASTDPVWKALGGGGSSVTVADNDNIPANGNKGDMYFNTTNGQLFVSPSNGANWVTTSNLSLGVVGGQTVIGGAAANEDLTLTSTKDAAKGNIFFGTSTYDELNNRLGIGMIAPAEALDVVGNIAASGNATISGGNLTLGKGDATTPSSIVFHDGDASDSKTTTLQSSADVSVDFTLTLPADGGADGQVLKTDGSGKLTWTNPGGAIDSGTDAPTYEASSGTLYYETDEKQLWVSDGAAWQLLAGKTATVAGNLYAGEVSDAPTFNLFSWSDVSAGPAKASDIISIPEAIALCTLSASNYVWLAFPKAWGSQDFFYQYGTELYPVFDGIEKRVIANGDGTDYQLWLFKTKSTDGLEVSLVVK